MPNTTALAPGDKVQLSEPQRTALGRQCRDLCQDLEQQHSVFIRNIGTWWKWYNAEPDVARRSTPWHGSSNIVVPFIRSQADSLASRAILTVFNGSKLWHNGPIENQFFKDRADPFLDYMNRSANTPFNTFNAGEAAITEQYVIGEAVLYQRHVRRERYIVPPRNPGAPVKVSYGESVELLHTPREQCLWPRGVPIREAEVIARQVYLSPIELVRQAKLDNWDPGATERALGQRGIEGPTESTYRERQASMGAHTDAGGQFEPHDIRELWLDWKLFRNLDGMGGVAKINRILDADVGDEVTVPVIVTLHRITGEVLNATYSPYLTPGWPFYELHYRKLSGPGNGSHGIAKIGEHIQRGLSTIINQSVDAVTLNNSLKAFTTDRDLANRTWVPNTMTLVKSFDSLQFENTGTPVQPDIAVANMLQAMGERAIGQSDPNLGRETRLGGHPQPATNFLGLLEQAQILNTRPMKSIRSAFSAMGEDRAMMFQQFERNAGGWIGSTFDPDDAQKIMEVLSAPMPAPGQLPFDLRAMSELHNPDAERKKSLLVYQVTKDYYATLMKFVEVAANPQIQPPMKKVAARAVFAMGDSMKRFLENSDIDEVEQYVIQAQSQQQADTAQLGRVAQFAQSQLDAAAAGAAGNGAIPAGAGGPESGPIGGQLPEPAVGGFAG